MGSTINSSPLESFDVFPKSRQAHRHRRRGNRDSDQCLLDRRLEFRQRRVRHRERGDVGATGPEPASRGSRPAGLAFRVRNDHHRSGGDKAKAVAVAKYPGGTVNRVLKLSDGSYAVHMIKISWPHHVFVSKNFKVTGAIG
jgi:hypothetical protein